MSSMDSNIYRPCHVSDLLWYSVRAERLSVVPMLRTERTSSSVFLFTTEFRSSLRFAHSSAHYSLGSLPRKVRRPWR